MTRALTALVVFWCWLGLPTSVVAQEAPPRLPLVVVDLHGAATSFPDNAALAESRALISQAELPGVGFGGDIGIHVYPLKWRVVTFGIGAQGVLVQSHRFQDATSGQASGLRSVTERFGSIVPELSFNFGSGDGWSYLSGGIGGSQWSIVPDGLDRLDSDFERLKTISYGGGARWFAQPHLAFSFDIRFYAVNPGSASGNLPGSPRTTLVIFSAGVSIK